MDNRRRSLSWTALDVAVKQFRIAHSQLLPLAFLWPNNPGPVEVDRRPHYPKLRVQFLVAFWTIFQIAAARGQILS